MARKLKITTAYNSGLYDSDTSAKCVTEKVIDVTEDCPRASNKDRSIFIYTRTKRGRIVQMAFLHKGEKYIDMDIYFFVDELEREMHGAPLDNNFGWWANELGLSKSALRSLIEANAPAA